MLSVRLASKVRNCLPFLVNPRTWEPEQTNIFSCGVPTAPPRSILVIFCPGSVLNTGWNRNFTYKLIFNTLISKWLYDWKRKTLTRTHTTASPFFIPKHVSIPSWSAIATWNKEIWYCSIKHNALLYTNKYVRGYITGTFLSTRVPFELPFFPMREEASSFSEMSHQPVKTKQTLFYSNPNWKRKAHYWSV